MVKTVKIGVIGLGYVGLPLAAAFSKRYSTLGFDINNLRLQELRQGFDNTLELTKLELSEAKKLKFTGSQDDLKGCNIYIITVPTPINSNKQPDLASLINATKIVARVLGEGDVVIYESTVYPGATEEECVPILERYSKLKFNKDFFCGYSPERINPGDKLHRLEDIVKVTSGSTPAVAEMVDKLYSSIITAGTFRASSIKVAEAAKVIENTQRDVNIGLINELALIFKKLNIDTEEVLKAAESKWNFLSFRPGLVGGHCIGVDPYYLTHKAKQLGYNAEIILAGRRLNDAMAAHVADEMMEKMVAKGIDLPRSKILLLGVSFKENCPDIRNTKVIDVVNRLESFVQRVDCYDPWVDPGVAKRELGIAMLDRISDKQYDAVLIAVAHKQFEEMGAKQIRGLCKTPSVIYDLKYLLPVHETDLRL